MLQPACLCCSCDLIRRVLYSLLVRRFRSGFCCGDQNWAQITTWEYTHKQAERTNQQTNKQTNLVVGFGSPPCRQVWTWKPRSIGIRPKSIRMHSRLRKRTFVGRHDTAGWNWSLPTFCRGSPLFSNTWCHSRRFSACHCRSVSPCLGMNKQ